MQAAPSAVNVFTASTVNSKCIFTRVATQVSALAFDKRMYVCMYCIAFSTCKYARVLYTHTHVRRRVNKMNDLT